MKVNKSCDTFSVPYFSYFFRPHHSQSVLAIPAWYKPWWEGSPQSSVPSSWVSTELSCVTPEIAAPYHSYDWCSEHWVRVHGSPGTCNLCHFLDSGFLFWCSWCLVELLAVSVLGMVLLLLDWTWNGGCGDGGGGGGDANIWHNLKVLVLYLWRSGGGGGDGGGGCARVLHPLVYCHCWLLHWAPPPAQTHIWSAGKLASC